MFDGANGTLVHATAIALGDRSALIRGPSKSGKSDLALRCLFLPQHIALGNKLDLVADDQVQLSVVKRNLYASAPASLRGRLEVRGLGIVDIPSLTSSKVCLLVELSHEDESERLPDPWPYETLLGCTLPLFKLNPFRTSAPHKLALALAIEPWLST